MQRCFDSWVAAWLDACDEKYDGVSSLGTYEPAEAESVETHTWIPAPAAGAAAAPAPAAPAPAPAPARPQRRRHDRPHTTATSSSTPATVTIRGASSSAHAELSRIWTCYVCGERELCVRSRVAPAAAPNMEQVFLRTVCAFPGGRGGGGSSGSHAASHRT